MPPKRSLLASAWPVAQTVYAGLTPPDRDDSPPAQPPAPFLLKRLAPDWTLPAPPPAVAWTPPSEVKEEEPIPFDWARETVRHAGTVVHAWLQRIAEDQLKGWDEKRVESLRSRFETELKRRGVSAAELDRALGIVLTALKNVLADDRGRWLLGPHPFASNEHRLRVRGRSLRIDRYFQTSDGVKWVVDYKTSPQEGGGVATFLDQQRERYGAQLDEYAEAVEGARRGLYFPLHKGWREW